MDKFWGEPFDVAVRGLASPGGTLPRLIQCLGALCCWHVMAGRRHVSKTLESFDSWKYKGFHIPWDCSFVSTSEPAYRGYDHSFLFQPLQFGVWLSLYSVSDALASHPALSRPRHPRGPSDGLPRGSAVLAVAWSPGHMGRQLGRVPCREAEGWMQLSSPQPRNCWWEFLHPSTQRCDWDGSLPPPLSQRWPCSPPTAFVFHPISPEVLWVVWSVAVEILTVLSCRSLL